MLLESYKRKISQIPYPNTLLVRFSFLQAGQSDLIFSLRPGVSAVCISQSHNVPNVKVCDARKAQLKCICRAHKRLPEFSLPVEIEQTGRDIKNKMKDNAVPQCVIFSAKGCY